MTTETIPDIDSLNEASCPDCREKIFWQCIHGNMFCLSCNPPAAPDQFEGWWLPEPEAKVIRVIERLEKPTTAREISQRIRGINTEEARAILAKMTRLGIVEEITTSHSTRYALPNG